MNRKSLLSALQRPIAFHKIFAQISGGITSGLFLSQLFYWHDKGSDPDGWIYKNYREWEEETTMTRRELDTARKRLKAIAVIEEKKAGAPAKLFYRIDFDKLIALINEFEPMEATNKDGDTAQTSLAHSAKLECTNPPNSLLYTENTSETTTPRAAEKKAVVVGAESDPFYTGQARQIAREVVKVSRQINAPKNFITDSPWGKLADEIGKNPQSVWEQFQQFMIGRHGDKQNPANYVGRICSSIYQNPGSELNCQEWLEFSDYFRKNLSAPPPPKKSEPRQPQITQIPDREASRKALKEARRAINPTE